MKLKPGIIVCFVFFIMTCFGFKNQKMNDLSKYKVFRLQNPMTIDGNWNKTEWQAIKAVRLTHFMGKIPEFFPVVKAKMMYDSDNLYVIFLVKDRYVRCVTRENNGPVWEDSCVEFFFSPDSATPLQYFNLEMNCGGTPLMHYNYIPRKKFDVIDPELINQIEIAHTLPEIIDPEITNKVTWILEYRIPLGLLKKAATITQPAPGIIWKANFYKIADKTSNPHYLTWSMVNNPEPDFHLPESFGELIFQ